MTATKFPSVFGEAPRLTPERVKRVLAIMFTVLFLGDDGLARVEGVAGQELARLAKMPKPEGGSSQ